MSEEIRKIVPPEYYTNHFSSIVFKTTFGNCVHRALCLRQWKQYQSGAWNLQWCEKERINDVFEEGITPAQRVNHHRLYTQLCKKDMLMKNVRKHKRELMKQKLIKESEWDFLPSTYFLPSEYIMFLEDFKKRAGLWILKPTGRCQGSGIFLVNKLAQVAPYRVKANPVESTENNQSTQAKQQPSKRRNEKPAQEPEPEESEDEQSEKQKQNLNNQQESQPNQTFIIQKYIDNPLLFGNKKFDMRIYVLCTDYRNLTLWLYRSGFARFTHEPYNPADIDNLGGHLTNVEIQKHCPNYDPVRGGKWLLHEFKHYLFSRFGQAPVNKCFNDIKQIIIKSIQSVQKRVLPSKSSFELYGYDFMADSNLHPWLIEVNGGPSMSANTDFDCRLKCGLIDDVLSIVDLQGILEGNEMTVGGFDLIMKKDVPVIECPDSEAGCLLGARNQRVKCMRHIGYKFMSRKQQQLKDKTKAGEKTEQKKKKKQEEKKPDKKLLPNFYYSRKNEEINQNIINVLKSQLQFLTNCEQQNCLRYPRSLPR